MCFIKKNLKNVERKKDHFCVTLTQASLSFDPAVLRSSMMGSVRHRLSEPRHDCNVVLVGDCRVGKSALVNRFINNKFNEVGSQTKCTEI